MRGTMGYREYECPYCDKVFKGTATIVLIQSTQHYIDEHKPKPCKVDPNHKTDHYGCIDCFMQVMSEKSIENMDKEYNWSKDDHWD